jgi:dTDP-4-dehydrorhamnose 3,5-epimerase
VIFTETILYGAYLINLERVEDERGFFARVWCRKEFEAHGLSTALVQCNVSFNALKGTLRGMHFQVSPHEEVKLVRCTMGAIYDVLIDLRKNSPTYLRHFAEVLSAENRNMFYIPEGFAHGFITLEDRTEVFYQMSAFYNAEAAKGVRWNDPAFGIRWPSDVRVISDRDRNYPDFPELGSDV